MKNISKKDLKKLISMGFDETMLKYMTDEYASKIIEGKMTKNQYIFKIINNIVDKELEIIKRIEKLNNLINISLN